MSSIPSAQPAPRVVDAGLRASITRRPLTAYFILAFALTWIFTLPMAFSRDVGMGLLPYELPSAIQLLLFLLASFIGPSTAALIVTGVTEGRAGIRQLLRRCIQWRVGPRWYAVVLTTNLLIWLLSYSALMGPDLLVAAVTHWPLLFTTFLPLVAYGIVIPSIAEEPGWRGFALPRLQQRYGPVFASLILGLLHGLWHVPGLMTIMLGPKPLADYLPFMLTAMMTTMLYTWVYNRTAGSILIAMLFHASGNAAVGWLTVLLENAALQEPQTGWAGWLAGTGWINVLGYGLAALLLLLYTRGRLGAATPVHPDAGSARE